MQALAVKYGDRGYQTFCFPSNQFGQQEPWQHAEIQKFVTTNWPDLNAVLFEKIDVNGGDTHPVFVYLKGVYEGDITWNFASKFVIGRDGIPSARFDSSETWEQIEAKIEEELNKQSKE
mmetsp:Transcript_60339/g.95806  ORF Transcript_60339/g.95806 Transcript_60339/m.95806 type:complete len:119 (-) Transcript_60339:273-629(-)